MTREQVEWAKQHDWYHGFDVNEYEDNDYFVWVEENGNIHPWPFKTFKELKEWAGY